MNVNKTPIVHPYDPDTYGDAAFDPVDDAPDLSTPYWIEQFSKVKVQRGRPLAAAPKISTTIRLDPADLTACGLEIAGFLLPKRLQPAADGLAEASGSPAG